MESENKAKEEAVEVSGVKMPTKKKPWKAKGAERCKACEKSKKFYMWFQVNAENGGLDLVLQCRECKDIKIYPDVSVKEKVLKQNGS